MPETAAGLYYPDETGHIPDVPADMKKQNESIEKLLTGSAGKLLIAQKTGAAAFKAMKGDATLAEDGTLSLAAASKPLTWYTPKKIATEQTRENVAFGTLATPDEIQNVVLPENGLILVGYAATWKSSVATNGRADIFLGANQVKMASELKGAPVGVPATTAGTVFGMLATGTFGLRGANEERGTSQVTTGQILGLEMGGGTFLGGMTMIFAAAGTYNVSIQFKSQNAGNLVTVKERKLWVAVIGV